MAQSKKQQVLIVGGGFGGIKAALELADDKRFTITLVSDQTTFRYYPALYRTATGGTPANSILPLSELLKDTRVQLVIGQAVSIDRRAKTVSLADKTALGYDSLVLGLGVVTNYFGIPGMAENSYSIKSLEEIVRFKNHLHTQIEDERRPDLNYVIVGAGPTGIELAGSLPTYVRQVMEWHGIKKRPVHIDLVEAAPRLLPRFPKDVSQRVGSRLRSLGVRLYIGKTVQGITADELTVSGKPIRSHTVVWTAGVTNHPFFKDNGFTITPRGKVATDIFLQADDNIYVIGDNANTPYSGMAQTAMRDGIYVAESLKRRLNGGDARGYKVTKPITVIPVGEHWATVVWGKVHLFGWIGWVLRELADLVAFSDYQPWWKAGRQWLTGFEEEEDCEICKAAMRAQMSDK